MSVEREIKEYIAGQAEPKRSDLQKLHELILQVLPGGKLWFDTGKNSEGKIINNPTIGYGSYTIQYADGKSRDSFQIGLSGNTTGISVYILGIKDKKYFSETYGKEIGKASVTGYCIKFKTVKEININVLEAALRYGVHATSKN